MLWATLGIIIGIIVGLNMHYAIPIEYIKYTAVIIVGIIDSLFGAIKAEMTKEDYNPTVFITGLVTNIFLAIGITLLGEQLGLDLYLAATVVFTFRIFSNVGIIRRSFLKNRGREKRTFYE